MPITRREVLASASAFAGVSALPLHGQSQTTSSAPDTLNIGNSTEPVCLTDFEPLAKQKMPAMGWEYMTAGAADELTLKWNTEA